MWFWRSCLRSWSNEPHRNKSLTDIGQINMRISVEEIEQVFHSLIERIKRGEIKFLDIETDY
jgi:hypothetical protein